MYGLLILGGLLLIALAAALVARRRRPVRHTEMPKPAPRLSPQAQLTKLRQTGRFWGIKVESHCRASSSLAGRQYTFNEPPTIPAAGCTEAACNCLLVGLPERRKMVDRRSGLDRRQSLRGESGERRTKQPRRDADVNSWVAYSHL